MAVNVAATKITGRMAPLARITSHFAATMGYTWASYRSVGCTYRNSTSIRMVNRYVLPGVQHLKDGDMVKNVHFFESLDDLMEIYPTPEDCSFVTETYLEEKKRQFMEKATLAPASKRRVIPTYNVAHQQSFNCR